MIWGHPDPGKKIGAGPCHPLYPFFRKAKQRDAASTTCLWRVSTCSA